MKSNVKRLGSCLVAALMLATLAACAPAPIYKTTPGAVQVRPAQVARTPERFHDQQVVWGGVVVGVRNLTDHSEIEILSYPLDSSQRPELDSKNTGGRFIALVDGYVEPLNFRNGTPITVLGHISGQRAGQVGKANYVFPLVRVDRKHVWTAEELRKGHPHFNFGVGVGASSGGRSGVGVGVGVH